MEEATFDLPPEMLPLDEFAPEEVKAPCVSIGRLPENVSKELSENFGLGEVTGNLPKLLARVGADYDAATSLNSANGSNLVAQGVLTSLLIRIGNLVVDKASVIEMTPHLTDVAKVLIKVNSAQVAGRVAVARANTENMAVRARPRATPTSFTPGQQIDVSEVMPEKVN